MKYSLTVERAYRACIEFEAESEEEAMEKAETLVEEIGDDEFDDGWCEQDYALCDEDGKTLIDWD